VRVFLVAEDSLVLAGLGALLSADAEISVLGQGSPESDIAARVAATSPDVVVWDLGAGGADSLPEGFPMGAPVLALVADGEQAGVALAAGAHGTVFRDAGGARLAAALRAVAEGLFVSEEALTLSAPRQGRAVVEMVEPLTPREREVLDLAGPGLDQSRDRRATGDQRAHGEVPRQRDPREARSRESHRGVAEAARLGLVVF
jgi:DNA-binding NarL/FixJ family response regulator